MDDQRRLREQREATVRRHENCQMTALFIVSGADLVCELVYFDSATLLRQLTG